MAGPGRPALAFPVASRAIQRPTSSETPAIRTTTTTRCRTLRSSRSSCPYRLKADSDGDAVLDGFEVANGSNACDAASTPACTDTTDSDGDGLNNCIERAGYNTCEFTGDTVPGYTSCVNPMDSDADGCSDTLEVMDINGDRKVAVGDLTLLAKRSAGLIPPFAVSDEIFDVNKDGKISIGDLTLMAKNTCIVRPNQIGCPVCPPE